MFNNRTRLTFAQPRQPRPPTMTRSRAPSALAAAAPHLLATAVAGADQTPWLPQEPNFPLGPGAAAGYNAYHRQAAGRHWHNPSHTTRLPDQYSQPQFAHAGDSLAVQTHTLPRATRQLTPTITFSADPYTPDSQVQPQDSHCNSATSIYAPWRNNFSDLDGVFEGSNYALPVTRRPVQTPHGRNMADVIPPQMATGTNGLASPTSDHQPAMSRQITPSHIPMGDTSVRKRSFSEMSQGPQQMQMPAGDHQSPHESPYGNSPGNVDDSQGHKVQRMIKRGEPPQAHDGKYYCDFAQECTGLYFDRKCEWSKHMDKHDRPYRCQQPQCAKLQGFTYSGGLLRHEREVHNKHGGPKDALRCNVAHCKRFNGKGFTRKENLNEHLRRVHGITSDAPSNPTNPSNLRQIAADAAPGADMIETPASRFSETGEIDELNTSTPYPDLNKRRRLDNGASPRSNDDLEQELQRLKADNLEKDERIRRMEANDSAREARMKSLEDTLSQLTSHGLQRVPDQAPMTSHMGTNMNMGNIDHTMDSNIDQSLGNTMGGAIGSYPEFNGTVVEKND